MKMLKFLSVFVLLLLSVNGFARTDSCKVNLKATVLQYHSGFKKKTSVCFYMLKHIGGVETSSYFLKDTRGKKFYIDKNIKDYLDFKYTNVQEYCDASMILNVINNLDKKGHQYELRKEMEEEALDYINKVKNYDLELNDPYLYDYIYGLMLKMVPDRYIDGREYDVNVLIQQSPDINACMYPNGTMVINTGLLAALHSEDELVAILAHEFGHFLMDHSIINVNKAETRKKRAAFWTAVLTGATAITEGVAASNGHYYTPGLGTLAMATLTTEISRQVVEHLGMIFNHEQEIAADLFAVDMLRLLGYNENALATALNRIGEECDVEYKNAMYLESYTHPKLLKRIKNIGKPVNLDNIEYEQKVSFAVSNIAMIKFFNRRFRKCLPLVSQNIDNNVANADDYLLKANCILVTKNNNESNSEVAGLISKAKAIDPENINILKCEILLSFRLNDNLKAISLLEQYKEALKTIEDKTMFVLEESKWAKDMLIKLKGMTTANAA